MKLITHEYLKLLVVENKLIDYQYFMDEIETYEIFELIQLIPWANKTSYEQMRYMVWASLKPYLKNEHTTPMQLVPLYTDVNTYNAPELSAQEIDKYEAIKQQILEKYAHK